MAKELISPLKVILNYFIGLWVFANIILKGDVHLYLFELYLIKEIIILQGMKQTVNKSKKRTLWRWN